MLQRIQTLYLLIVMIIMGLMLFFPYATALNADMVEYQLSFKGFSAVSETGFHHTMSTVMLAIFTAIIPLISLITINLYKRRMLQIRLSVFNIILMAGYYGMFYFVRYIVSEQNPGLTFHYHWTFIIPFISIILTYLAIRAIGKDEALVRSLDRLR